MNCRSLRLEWAAGLAMALAMLPASAIAQQIATQTAMTINSADQGGRTQATASVTVTDADGQPATGAVVIDDGNRQVAEVALNGSGQATSVIGLLGGNHALRAVYTGDTLHLGSASITTNLTTQTSSTPNFAITLAPVAPSTLPLNVSAGASGTIAVTIIPEDNSALTAPMFITLSCSGLPSLASCAFTPESVEILPTTTASRAPGSPASSCPPVSSMLIQTQGPGTSQAVPLARPGHRNNPVAWAILLPGMLSLGGLAWSARRRRWLSRLALLALVALVTTLGTTACNPLYYYYNHGPTPTPPTPSGTYNVTVTAQSSNGVAAITNSTTMVLTVN
jgi:hypothetical protein